MGAGRSLEAAYTLSGPIPAGTWTLVADGIILQAVDVTFEIVWRHGGSDTVLASFEQHFDPLPDGGYRAQAYERTAEIDEVAATAGDLLVFRYAGRNSELMMAYIPNGDGDLVGGRIPFLDLPPD